MHKGSSDGDARGKCAEEECNVTGIGDGVPEQYCMCEGVGGLITEFVSDGAGE